MVDWAGQSGAVYSYTIHRDGDNLPVAGGNYIFVRFERGNGYYALYIGQTSNLSNRIPSHEKLPCARNHSMNQLHYRVHNGNEASRLAEESDLIKRWTPPCNDQ